MCVHNDLFVNPRLERQLDVMIMIVYLPTDVAAWECRNANIVQSYTRFILFANASVKKIKRDEIIIFSRCYSCVN